MNKLRGKVEQEENIEHGLGLMYEVVDSMLDNKKYKEVDDILSDAETRTLHPELRLGLLTITNVSRGNLKNRQIVVDGLVEDLSIEYTQDQIDEILRGLV